jgi:CspA family cold shock protein
LVPGDIVEFRVEHTLEGPRTVDVVVLRSETTNGRVMGNVVWFSHRKQYGFIRRSDGLADVFVHERSFRDPEMVHWLNGGDAVEFGIEQTARGPKAVDVIVL